jgi:hypothetical protein
LATLAEKSVIREELRKPATVHIEKTGETLAIPRFCLDQIFDTIDLMSDEENGLGDALDLLTGNLNFKEYRQVAVLTEEASNKLSLAMANDTNEEQREALLAEAEELNEMAENLRLETVAESFSIPKIMKAVAKSRKPFYKLIALGLQKDEAWIGANLNLEEMVDVIFAVVKQEFTGSFFVKIRSFGSLWQETKTHMTTEPETLSSGSGPLLVS